MTSVEGGDIQKNCPRSIRCRMGIILSGRGNESRSQEVKMTGCNLHLGFPESFGS